MIINSRNNKPINIYLKKTGDNYCYKNKEYTEKFSKNELIKAFFNGCVTYYYDNKDLFHIPYVLNIFENYCSIEINLMTTVYSSEYIS